MGDHTDSKKVPFLLEGADVRALPLGPFEGFVLSRIDGRSTTSDIADLTGVPIDKVEALVEKLCQHGVAEWREAPRPSVRPPSASRSSRPSTPMGRISEAPPRVHTRPPPAGTTRVLYDPAELEEPDVELDLERRRLILDFFYRLKEKNLYELLDVPRDAEKKAIRDSYFQLSKLFHPDTLYGKKLGSYKSKMEAVFDAITEAYETLGKKKKRREYDLFLGLSDPAPTNATSERARRDAETVEKLRKQAKERNKKSSPSVPKAENGASDSSRGSDMNASASSAKGQDKKPSSARAPKTSSAGTMAQSAAKAMATDAAPDVEPTDRRKPISEVRQRQRTEQGKAVQRELTRRRLGFRKPQSAPAATPERAERSQQEMLRDLAGSLRSAALVTGGMDRAAGHVQAARTAEEAKDWLTATNAYRLALSFEDDPAVRADYERVSARLAAETAETSEKQAIQEEQAEKWGAAALSWKKVVEGRPNSAEPLCRAARAIIRSGGDLKHARELGQRAVQLKPDSKQCRVTLAQVYLAAGMKRSAEAELQHAAKLDPSDEIVKNLLRDL